MWMKQDEFIKFVCNLKQYIDTELKFVDTIYDYPVVQINDIRLYFNHAKTEEEASVVYH